MFYHPNVLKNGCKVIINKEPCVIIENECIKPGKGQAFSRIRFKSIKTGKILEKTLKSGEFLESAHIREIRLIYLYRDDELFIFMNKQNFDQVDVHCQIIGNTIKWLQEQFSYLVTFWNDDPILVTPPDYMQLKIVKTISVMRNTVVSSGTKLATVSTGAVIKVPIFIQIGDLIKINTHLSTYISRVNNKDDDI